MATAEIRSADRSLVHRAAGWLLQSPVTWLSLVLFLSILPARPEMASAANVQLLLLSTALLAVLAIGQTFVLVTAGIDLSVPAVMSIASVMGAAILTAVAEAAGDRAGVLAAVSVMLCVGTGIGVLHGLSVAVLRMPAFLVTLASLIGVGGLAVWWTQSGRIGVSGSSWKSGTGVRPEFPCRWCG